MMNKDNISDIGRIRASQIAESVITVLKRNNPTIQVANKLSATSGLPSRAGAKEIVKIKEAAPPAYPAGQGSSSGAKI